MIRLILCLSIVLFACISCTSLNLTGATFLCSSDSDCQNTEICASSGDLRVCTPLEAASISIGMCGPFQGPSADLGNEMRRRIQVAFDHINGDGGVRGRKLELVTQNDSYDPALSAESVSKLLDIQQINPNPDAPDVRGPNGVFALLGNVGTPTMLVTAPIATKNGVVFFAPFTGSQRYLRDNTNSPYVFNYRAGYFEETQAMIDYIATQRIPRIITDSPDGSYQHILVFQQNDSFGNSGYEGTVNAFNKIRTLQRTDSIRRITYERENLSTVEPAIDEAKVFLANILKTAVNVTPIAIIMVDTYQPGNKFIRAIKDWMNEDLNRARLLDVLFFNVSFVGSDSLAQALIATPDSYSDILNPGSRKPYTENVMVTQVVPYYGSQVPTIVEYRRDIDRFDGGEYSHTSLEGYIVARLFNEALTLASPGLTTERLLDVLNTDIVDLNIGIGPLMNFSSINHQASHTVWGTSIEPDGSFSVPFIWNPLDKIIPN